MIVKFMRDYTGRETAMQAYKAGAQADLPTAQALELVRLGVAEEMWAKIGRMYDPPKPARAEGGPVEAGKPYIIGSGDIAIFAPASGKVISQLPDNEEAPKAKKPRGKGKGKAK